MVLMAGSRLGPYEILSLVGTGGMGQVYQAKDTRLDRMVAIKVLPSHLSGDLERRKRFEREARAVSSLNHPHICILHDIGRQDGTDYLVMEYLEGVTLAARLQRGALQIDEILRHATQIAWALDKAHRRGVIHRDLKPSNVMLTKSGVKVLDFGLARLVQSQGAPVDDLDSLTTHTSQANLTLPGEILGTLPYMAPEQVEGKVSDARADMFSMGAVLFEMATGRRAFQGNSQAALIASILKQQVSSLAEVAPQLPRALDRLVMKCLEKDPEERWQSAADLAVELTWIAEARSQQGAEMGTSGSRADRRMLWVLATCVLAVLVAVLTVLNSQQTRFQHQPPGTAAAFAVGPPDKSALGSTVALSPDGRHLAFGATQPGGKSPLFVRPLDSLDARALPGTDGASFPFWSPDSRFIAFFATEKLKKIDISGGSPQTLSDAVWGTGGTWSQTGTILFGLYRDLIYAVSDSGGTPVPVTKLDQARHEYYHSNPQFLRDGRHFIFLAYSVEPELGGIYGRSLEDNEPKRLLSDVSIPTYAHPGYLLLRRSNQLVAYALNEKELSLASEPVVLAKNIGTNPVAHLYSGISASTTGILTYYQEGGIHKSDLAWFDRKGQLLRSVGRSDFYRDPSISTDEEEIAFGIRDPQTGKGDIWSHQVSRGASRVTYGPVSEWFPLYLPGRRSIVFASNANGPFDLYLTNGAGAEQALLSSEAQKWPTSASGNAELMLYQELNSATQWDLGILQMSGESKSASYFLNTRFNELRGQFSPDARWIAYASDESGEYEVYAREFPSRAHKWKISGNGGTSPFWRRDGKELFYLAPDNKIMAVTIQTVGSFRAGVPFALFEASIGHLSGRNDYAVTADGQRFLINTVPADARAPLVTVTLNWTDLLRKR